jgi:hypothetical protein
MSAAEHHEGRPWPPLIVADNTPRWIKRRDFVLTLAMWLLFVAMLEAEFELVIKRNLVRLGFGDFRTNPNWAEYFERLAPYILVSSVLVLLLAAASLLTLRRRHRSLVLPPPPPLSLAEQVRDAGMDEKALVAARDWHVAVVHIDADGKLRVERR